MSICVLIVEDNADLRMLYEQAMSGEGYTTASAANGKEALELLRNGTIPRIILLDLMMPVMDGWQFLKERAADSALAAIPVVVCSASKENIPDAVPFLRKPVELDALLQVARDHCQ